MNANGLFRACAITLTTLLAGCDPNPNGPTTPKTPASSPPAPPANGQAPGAKGKVPLRSAPQPIGLRGSTTGASA